MAKDKTQTAVVESTTAVNPEIPAPIVEENTMPVVPATSTPIVEENATSAVSVSSTTANEEIATPVTTEINNILVYDPEVVDPNIFNYNGKNYKLSDRVEKLQIDGRVYLREEILTNNEIMTSLIVGNSPFVKKA